MKWVLVLAASAIIIVGGFFLLKSLQNHTTPMPPAVNQSGSTETTVQPTVIPSSNTNSTTVVNPSSTTRSSNTPTITPQSGVVHVPKSDEGNTIYVTVGSTLILDYKTTDYQWGDTIDSNFFQVVSPTELKVLKAGTAIIHSDGQPNCTPGAACPTDYPTASIRVISS